MANTARHACIQSLKHVIKFAVSRRPANTQVPELCNLKYSLREPIKWKFSSSFCNGQWKNGNRSAWFHIHCSTHVVVDDRDVVSMEEESQGSLISYGLIILDLLRWSNGRTCTRIWQSWVFFWAGWLVLNGQVRTASNKTAEIVGHAFLLLKWSPGIVRLGWLGWFMCNYCLDMSCFNIVVR